MIPISKLNELLARAGTLKHEALRALESPATNDEGFDRASKALLKIEPVVPLIGELYATHRAVADAESLLGDPEVGGLAEEELPKLRMRTTALEQAIRIALLPRDEADARSAILEVHRSSGAEDAAIFAAELFAMYGKYAGLRGWHFHVLHYDETRFGGVRSAVAFVDSAGAFGRLRFETGVHPVSRVPYFDTQGRIQNSSARVAVLPAAGDMDVKVGGSDICVEVISGSDADGRRLDAGESATRISHIPTGIVVTARTAADEVRNQANGMKILYARLYERKRRLCDGTPPTSMFGWEPERRVRTYNFRADRASDPETGIKVLGVDRVMQGEIDVFIDALIANEQATLLAACDELGDWMGSDIQT